MATTTLELIRPDDWHLHVRDHDALPHVVPHTARQFGRAIIMPNLAPPVTTVQAALAYRKRIQAAIPAGVSFDPLMTLYLTDTTPTAEIEAAADEATVVAAKLYPAGATTHSDAGVTDIDNITAVLETLQRVGMPLLIHGEVTAEDVDVFDREAIFIETVLAPLMTRFPALKIVLEHITTRLAVDFVRAAPPQLGATITAHHLLNNRNIMLAGRIRPHHYCLPILKRETDRQALVAAATSGESRFFLGTDSAPHPRHAKESACGCAGSYTAHAAMALYTEVFEDAGALDQLERFASFNGADFYGLARNTTKIILRKTPWKVPAEYPLGDSQVIPLRAGETLRWQLEGQQT